MSEVEKPHNHYRSNKGLTIVTVIAVGFAAFFAGMYFSNQNSESNADSDAVTKEEFNRAILMLESKMEQLQLPTNQPKPVKISIDDDPILGDKNAPITILEFSDYQCPFCARFHAQTLPLIIDEYIETGKVNFVYRDFPIQSTHPNALPAAVASECADEQGKFWEYHDMLFENQNSWNKMEIGMVITTFKQYATELGLSQELFSNCLDSGKYLDEVRKDLDDGRTYDVTGTPGFFIGNDEIGYVMLNGAQPFEAFKQVIETQLGS